MTPVEYAREVCKEKGIKISKLEKSLGMANGYLNPKKKTCFEYQKAVEIAKYLDCDLDKLLTEEQRQSELHRSVEKITKSAMFKRAYDEIREELKDYKPCPQIPIVSRVAAGIPIDATQNLLGWIDYPLSRFDSGVHFALEVKGNSMEPGIMDGDTVIVREQPDAEDGQIVVAIVNGNEGVCKRLRKYTDGTIALISDNPSYAPMYFTNAEIDDCPVRIRGIVKELRRRYT